MIIADCANARLRQNCPTQDEPEGGACFQHKMSLKAITATTAGQGTLRGNVDYHAACRTSHADPDAAVSRSRRHAQLRRDRPQAGLRADRTYPTRLPIPRSVQEGQRHRAPLLGQGQRTQSLANHPFDRPLARARRPRAARFETPPLPAPLHARRYRSVSRRRRRARRPLGPRHPSHSRTRVQSLRQDRIPTISRDLALPHLQPTAHPGLSRTPCTPHQDARRGGEHRRAAQTRSARPGPAGCGSTRCIKATPIRARACITSMPSTRSRNGRWWAVAKPSPRPI